MPRWLRVTWQAQARLWEGLAGLGERLADLHAQLRELTVRRYRPLDVKRIEAEAWDAEEVLPDEDPAFAPQYQHNRWPLQADDHLYMMYTGRRAQPADPISLWNGMRWHCRTQWVLTALQSVLCFLGWVWISLHHMQGGGAGGSHGLCQRAQRGGSRRAAVPAGGGAAGRRA